LAPFGLRGSQSTHIYLAEGENKEKDEGEDEDEDQSSSTNERHPTPLSGLSLYTNTSHWPPHLLQGDETDLIIECVYRCVRLLLCWLARSGHETLLFFGITPDALDNGLKLMLFP
jgi:hypothetical protein